MQAGRAVDALDEAVALAHHHDAITGTAKQAVANDYARRLSAALAALHPAVADTLSAFIFRQEHSMAARGSGAVVRASVTDAADADTEGRCPQKGADVNGSGIVEMEKRDISLSRGQAGQAGGRPQLFHCESGNVSLCSLPQEVSKACGVLMLVVHNSVAWPRTANLQVRSMLPTSRHAILIQRGAACRWHCVTQPRICGQHVPLLLWIQACWLISFDISSSCTTPCELLSHSCEERYQ
jgi:hypothetical protein